MSNMPEQLVSSISILVHWYERLAKAGVNPKSDDMMALLQVIAFMPDIPVRVSYIPEIDLDSIITARNAITLSSQEEIETRFDSLSDQQAKEIYDLFGKYVRACIQTFFGCECYSKIEVWSDSKEIHVVSCTGPEGQEDELIAMTEGTINGNTQ